MGQPEYQITSASERGLLVYRITGRSTPQNAAQIAAAIISRLRADGALRVLIDCTQLEGRLGLTDTYYHVREYPKDAPRQGRVAVLDRPENADYCEFHETVAVNRGHGNLRFFCDASEARQWAEAGGPGEAKPAGADGGGTGQTFPDRRGPAGG